MIKINIEFQLQHKTAKLLIPHNQCTHTNYKKIKK